MISPTLNVINRGLQFTVVVVSFNSSVKLNESNLKFKSLSLLNEKIEHLKNF